MDTTAKIMTTERLAAWRAGLPPGAGGLAVVTGSFDILQPGNLSAVRRASECAKKVCVLVGNGGSRPWRSPAERAEIVSGLRFVSAVCVVSPGGNPAGLLESLRSFTHVACAEQSSDELAQTAERLAEKREALPLLPGCSTGEIVTAIRENRTPIKLPAVFAPGPELGRPVPSPKPGRKKAGRKGRSKADTPDWTRPWDIRAPSGPQAGKRASAGRRVVVSANGCFDVLHTGHLRFLAQARAMGDELIVLVNDDKSVREYKGPTRPVFPLEFRLAALLALEPVSHVCPFSGDNPLKTLDLLRPDIHVKGGSYEPERVAAERKLLASWGGSVRFCPMVENYSTTGWLEMVSGKG